MPRSRIALPEEVRSQICELLNRRLADLIDLQLQSKQAHWNVRGSNFIGVHLMFDDLNEDIEGYVDTVAERVVQLGGVAEGTSAIVAERSSLPPYPIDIQSSKLHLEAMSTALASAANEVRSSIDWCDDIGDADAVDILTEVSRGLDKWLWFVSAHVDVDEESPAWKSKAASLRAEPKSKPPPQSRKHPGRKGRRSDAIGS